MKKTILMISAMMLSIGIVSKTQAVILNVYDVVQEFPDCTSTGGATNEYGVAAFSCTSCPAGWYLNGSTCYPCTRGYYCPGGTNNRIKACSSNNYSPVNRATNVDEAKCTPCPDGYTANSGNGSCFREGMTSCPEGEIYSKGRCTTCGNGKYCPGGTSVEQTCPAGYQCLGGKKEPCPAGTYFGGTFAAHGCHSCPDGKVSIEGSSSCQTSCPAGTVQDGKACKNLPGCVNYADGACQECDSDYLTNSSGTCTPAADCKNGMHATLYGSCEENPAGCNTFEDDRCLECNDGLFRQGESCVSSCGANYKLSGDTCYRVRYTPAEAAEAAGESNTIFLYYK